MLYFITSNTDKAVVAKKQLLPLGITLKCQPLEFVEIQSNTIEAIAQDKAEQAFRILGGPLVVHDSGWYITALRGFPGPYMKYVNTWLSSKDLISLMQHHRNRKVIVKKVLCYIDNKQNKLFTTEIRGQMLTQPRGKGMPSDRVISLSADRRSIAENKAAGSVGNESDERLWREFAAWYQRLISPAKHPSV